MHLGFHYLSKYTLGDDSHFGETLIVLSLKFDSFICLFWVIDFNYFMACCKYAGNIL